MVHQASLVSDGVRPRPFTGGPLEEMKAYMQRSGATDLLADAMEQLCRQQHPLHTAQRATPPAASHAPRMQARTPSQAGAHTGAPAPLGRPTLAISSLWARRGGGTPRPYPPGHRQQPDDAHAFLVGYFSAASRRRTGTLLGPGSSADQHKSAGASSEPDEFRELFAKLCAGFVMDSSETARLKELFALHKAAVGDVPAAEEVSHSMTSALTGQLN